MQQLRVNKMYQIEITAFSEQKEKENIPLPLLFENSNFYLFILKLPSN